ncbi:hypothetical protein [Nonomuraea sp. NPDC049141]|uniref:hypothetical protein n=1 Tax=unclassified Nonomuraea TaxID=2593643 RepID=UPI0033CB8F12
MAVIDLQEKVSALQTDTVSGVPGTSIEQRFTSLHDRVDIVGKNVLDRIDKRTKDLDKKIETRADQLEKRIDARTDFLYEKVFMLSKDTENGFDRVNRDIASVDLRIGKVEARIDKVDKDIAELKAGFGELKLMLISIGAKSPEPES